MIEQVLTESLVIAVFLKLKLDGYCDEISLKQNDLQEMATKLEEIFIQNGLYDIGFLKEPEYEPCSFFKYILIDRFESSKLGKFNSEDSVIAIVDNPFLLSYVLKKLIAYDDILTQACNALTEDTIEVPSTLQTIKVQMLKMDEYE